MKDDGITITVNPEKIKSVAKVVTSLVVFAGVGVLVLAFAVAQAVSHRSLLLEIIGIVAMLVVTVRAWMELEKLDSRKRKK